MSPVKKLPLRKLLYIGYPKGSTRGAAPRSNGDWTLEKNQGHGKDLWRHQAYGKGLTDVNRVVLYTTKRKGH